jgi:F0F1-type ATP synthase membrane subunit b/b'
MHLLHHVWYGYFWPSDLGNGPEAIQQTVLYGLIALVFVPPIRHWAERHVKAIHDKLDHHHEQLLQQAEEHHERQMQQAETHHQEHLAAISRKGRDSKGRFT